MADQELTNIGWLVMPKNRRTRLVWACRAFWRVLHGQPAAYVLFGDGHIERLTSDGPVIVAPIGLEGRMGGDLVDAGPHLWRAGWDGSRWKTL